MVQPGQAALQRVRGAKAMLRPGKGFGGNMLETLLRLLEGLPDWAVYREVATMLDGDELVAWRRLYEARPQRDALLSEAVRILGTEAKKRSPLVVDGPR
jgi:hypothetical protein